MSQQQVAVVILNYNGASFLSQFLPTLQQYTPNARLVVADNASTDQSEEVVRNLPQVEWMPLTQNFGFAEGYNQALRHIQEPYSLLLNSDVEVSNGWLEPLVHFLEANPEFAACQPKIRSWHRPDYFEYAGAAGGFIDALGYPFCRGRLFDTLEKDEGQYDDAVQIAWTTGACMLIRTAVFKKAGGFDGRFFAHMEEVDLCWRLERSGHKLACIPRSIVYHVGGGTLPKSNPRKTFLNFRNGLVMLFRNSAPAHRWVKLPLRIFLDWGAFLQFLLKAKFSEALAIPRAHGHAFRLILKTKIPKKQAYPRLVTHSKCVIIWGYFLQFKRKFSEMKFSRDIKKVQI